TETPDEDQFEKGEFVDVPEGVTVDGDKATIAKLAVGETVTLTYKAKVDSDATRGKDLINKVEVTSNEGVKDSDENDDAYVPKKSSGGGGSSSKKDKEIVAGDVEEILNTEDHFQYVQGYPDGTVGPERNITRAEATVIFFRLLQDHVRAELLTAENNFPDVNLDDWFNLGVSTMESGGFVSGYEDGTFRPNGKITRAELATIISNFDELEPATENRFPDVEGHWAEAYINSAAEKGWLSGYDDGLYRPNQYITRAETMSMINRVLNRRVDADGLHADAKQWVDNPESKWYYYAVLEATNHHDYQRADVSDYENWTAINPEKVWEN
ncbi:MAG: S-layer homology domain-containing protein, partial [Anaerotignum sp.]|nr:S-layer homology domain-containing protein [Anaerotignum sp.]